MSFTHINACRFKTSHFLPTFSNSPTFPVEIFRVSNFGSLYLKPPSLILFFISRTCILWMSCTAILFWFGARCAGRILCPGLARCPVCHARLWRNLFVTAAHHQALQAAQAHQCMSVLFQRKLLIEPILVILVIAVTLVTVGRNIFNCW